MHLIWLWNLNAPSGAMNTSSNVEQWFCQWINILVSTQLCRQAVYSAFINKALRGTPTNTTVNVSGLIYQMFYKGELNSQGIKWSPFLFFYSKTIGQLDVSLSCIFQLYAFWSAHMPKSSKKNSVTSVTLNALCNALYMWRNAVFRNALWTEHISNANFFLSTLSPTKDNDYLLSVMNIFFLIKLQWSDLCCE